MNSLNRRPFFSVIMCTFNRGNILHRALTSLINQTCDDWEAIVIDDGSDDNTREVIRACKNDKIRYFNLTHGGLAMSRNRGIERAKGRYITFLDSDDEYREDHLQIRKDYLANHPEIELLHSTVEVIGDEFVPDKNDPGKLIAIKDCVVGGTFCIKKQSLGDSGKFQDGYSDDSVFFERFLAEGHKVARLDSPTYIYYRDGADSLCNIVTKEAIENK